MIRGLLLLGLALLGGCALTPSVPAQRPAQSESAPFALNGRVSIRHDGASHSAGLRWSHRPTSDELLLLGPLGQTGARVYRDAQGATLDDGNRHYQAADVESLMQEVLGWHLPLGGLHQWVLGRSAEGEVQIERDGHGRVAVLRQAGWEVRYLRYADEGADSLPARLQLRRDELQLQLLIDEWEWEAP